MEQTEIFLKRFKELYDGEKQEILAKELGISQPTLSNWKNSGALKSLPNADNLISIAKHSNVSVDWLIGLSEHRNIDDCGNVLEKNNNEDSADEQIIEKTKSEDVKSPQTYSDFVKKNIQECYTLMLNYVRSTDVLNPETYQDMCCKISEHEMAIPTEIFNKIEDFCEIYLDPITGDSETVFAKLYASGEMREDGSLVCDTEEQMMESISDYANIISEIEDKLTKFGEEELKPILNN